MNLPPIISQNLPELTILCEQFGVRRLYIFGSAGTEKFKPGASDLDLIVELNEMSPLERGENLIALWEHLEVLFNMKVDLITDQPIKNPFLRAEIERTKRLVYDGEKEEVPG